MISQDFQIITVFIASLLRSFHSRPHCRQPPLVLALRLTTQLRRGVRQMSAILEDVKPETAAKIAAQAKMRGLSVDEYLRSLLPDEIDLPEEKTFSPGEKAKLWRE